MDISRTFSELSEEKTGQPERAKSKSLSMHEGVAVWCDCCSCEAEPYWAELAEDLDSYPDNDYEE